MPRSSTFGAQPRIRGGTAPLALTPPVRGDVEVGPRERMSVDALDSSRVQRRRTGRASVVFLGRNNPQVVRVHASRRVARVIDLHPGWNLDLAEVADAPVVRRNAHVDAIPGRVLHRRGDEAAVAVVRQRTSPQPAARRIAFHLLRESFRQRFTPTIGECPSGGMAGVTRLTQAATVRLAVAFRTQLAHAGKSTTAGHCA